MWLSKTSATLPPKSSAIACYSTTTAWLRTSASRRWWVRLPKGWVRRLELRMKSRRRREWHLTVWILFLLAFVGAGALPFDTLGSQRRVRDQGPTNSSDAAYAADLSLENGSQRISECLQKLPANSRVAILFRLGTSQTVSSQMISLAAWMREFAPIPIASDAKNA